MERPSVCRLVRQGFSLLLTAVSALGILQLLYSPALAGESPVWPAGSWEVTTPRAAGMDENELNSARSYALTGSGSGTIVRGGKVVMSWGSLSTQYQVESTTKSIGVTALGLAMADGLVDLYDFAREHLSSIGILPASNASTGWLPRITVLNLATHTAGFDKDGGFTELLFKPGTAWSYSDGGANWLADALTARYREDLRVLLFDRVLTPIGITASDLTSRSGTSSFWGQTTQRRRFGGA